MKKTLHSTCVVLALIASVHQVAAQGTPFTYQGRLNNGTNLANGTYSLAFTLFNTNTGGSLIGHPSTNFNVNITAGLFTVPVDFGPNVFTGATNWLQIAVATNLSGLYINLTPRQQLTPVPYAIYAESANATNLVGAVQPANLAGVALLAGGNTFTGNQIVSGGNVGIGSTSPISTLEARNGGGHNLAISGPGGSEFSFFLAVDYNRIFTTAVGATQELARRLAEQTAENAELQVRVGILEANRNGGLEESGGATGSRQQEYQADGQDNHTGACLNGRPQTVRDRQSGAMRFTDNIPITQV